MLFENVCITNHLALLNNQDKVFDWYYENCRVLLLLHSRCIGASISPTEIKREKSENKTKFRKGSKQS